MSYLTTSSYIMKLFYFQINYSILDNNHLITLVENRMNEIKPEFY